MCKTCHESGLAGAPKFGDKAAWAVPIKSGFDVLIQHAINGLQRQGKVMPPKGGNPDLTDTEVARAVVVHGQCGRCQLQGTRCSGCDSASPASASPIATRRSGDGGRAAQPQPHRLPQLGAAPLDMKTAEAMMQKDGCAACHAVDKKIVGPAYQDVAAKYRGDKDALTKLVAEGEGRRLGCLGRSADAAQRAGIRGRHQGAGELDPDAQEVSARRQRGGRNARAPMSHYVIGDIQGCHDEFRQLLELIAFERDRATDCGSSATSSTAVRIRSA